MRACDAGRGRALLTLPLVKGTGLCRLAAVHVYWPLPVLLAGVAHALIMPGEGAVGVVLSESLPEYMSA